MPREKKANVRFYKNNGDSNTNDDNILDSILGLLDNFQPFNHPLFFKFLHVW